MTNMEMLQLTAANVTPYVAKRWVDNILDAVKEIAKLREENERLRNEYAERWNQLEDLRAKLFEISSTVQGPP